MPDSIPKQILVIDDDPTLRRLISFGLRRAGYQTLTADNGAVAMEILARQKVDLVLVDLMMPVVDGLRFLRWLRQEAKVETPALVFTSHDGAEITDKALASGATDLVNKPVQLPELLAKVARLISAEE
jgi:CheY-like chemotaxis protein